MLFLIGRERFYMYSRRFILTYYNDIVTYLVSLCGLVFVIASIGKLVDGQAFVSSIRALPLSCTICTRYMIISIPVVEFYIGLKMLLLGSTLLLMDRCVYVLLSGTFTVYHVLKISGMVEFESCGCTGIRIIDHSTLAGLLITGSMFVVSIVSILSHTLVKNRKSGRK